MHGHLDLLRNFRIWYLFEGSWRVTLPTVENDIPTQFEESNVVG